MRGQTRTNRHLGLNAGRERRMAAANRDAISAERRAEVFSQDVEHFGNDGDKIRPQLRAEPDGKTIATELMVLAMREAGMTYAQIVQATGLYEYRIRQILGRHGMVRRTGARLKWA